MVILQFQVHIHISQQHIKLESLAMVGPIHTATSRTFHSLFIRKDQARKHPHP
jgi:hypothetical protein